MINRGLSILLHTLCLGFTLLIFWFLLSGYFEILLILLGVVSVLTILWIANRMDKIDHEGHPIHLTLRTILYWPWLFKEIIITNIEVARIIISRDMPLTLSIIKIRSTQKTELGQVVYGNSITLTPGTVTLGIDKDIIKELREDRIKRLKELKETISEHNPEALFADGHDHAIMGYSSDGRVIYSVDQVVRGLVERDGMTPDEAIEFFNHNIECAYVGEYTPIYMYEE